MRLFPVLILFGCTLAPAQQPPHPVKGGYELPNGWRITPVGRAIPTEDMVLNIVPSPDGRAMIALHSGFNPHGIVVIDTKSEEAVQRLPLKSTWLGLAWHPDGKRLYVSGGNANGKRTTTLAPIYIFGYENGRLSKEPVGVLNESVAADKLYWSGLVHDPKKDILYAANRGTGGNPTNVVVFDTATGKLLTRIPVEVNPYALVLSEDARTLFVTNWASDSVSVIDTESRKVVATIPVGHNPTDMQLSSDGRLFVACSNENTVFVVDSKKREVIEKINTALFPKAPEGSTPNALALDRTNQMLFVANADNNDIAVINVAERADSKVLGFLPSGWYPSALALDAKTHKLYIGNSKGLASYNTLRGPHSPIAGDEGRGSIKSLSKGTVNIVSLQNLASEIKGFTRQVYANCPYNDQLLQQAKAPKTASIIPRTVGAGSPIKHVLYIIKENRTYDQVYGDIKNGNGDARLTIFGRNVTPNQHAIAEQFVLFDNLYCDGEVSVDGHSWSNSAYATDFNEKLWPVTYGGHSKAANSKAFVPSAGHIWDLCKTKGLTYRTYGEYANRVSDGSTFEQAQGVENLRSHVASNFKMKGWRDPDNAAAFIKEFDEYEKDFASADPLLRLPNFIVMSLPENHTRGAATGAHTPTAMVASNDLAVGMIVERVTHSKYWPQMAIFIIEDDAQDGSDHVDARRTAGLVISPYMKRGMVDSTLYTTSSMIRTMELLLGLPPMTQYDAAATPMYAAMGAQPDLAGFKLIKPQVSLDVKNTAQAYGAKESLAMDFSDVDLAPEHELNEIIWKSVKGADSPMPPPVHRYQFR